MPHIIDQEILNKGNNAHSSCIHVREGVSLSVGQGGAVGSSGWRRVGISALIKAIEDVRQAHNKQISSKCGLAQSRAAGFGGYLRLALIHSAKEIEFRNSGRRAYQ